MRVINANLVNMPTNENTFMKQYSSSKIYLVIRRVGLFPSRIVFPLPGDNFLILDKTALRQDKKKRKYLGGENGLLAANGGGEDGG